MKSKFLEFESSQFSVGGLKDLAHHLSSDDLIYGKEMDCRHEWIYEDSHKFEERQIFSLDDWEFALQIYLESNWLIKVPPVPTKVRIG